MANSGRASVLDPRRVSGRSRPFSEKCRTRLPHLLRIEFSISSGVAFRGSMPPSGGGWAPAAGPRRRHRGVGGSSAARGPLNFRHSGLAESSGTTRRRRPAQRRVGVLSGLLRLACWTDFPPVATLAEDNLDLDRPPRATGGRVRLVRAPASLERGDAFSSDLIRAIFTFIPLQPGQVRAGVFEVGLGGEVGLGLEAARRGHAPAGVRRPATPRDWPRASRRSSGQHEQPRASTHQRAAPGQGARRGCAHDHRQSPFEVGHVPDAAGQRGRGGSDVGEEVERFQQRRGVVLPAPQQRHHQASQHCSWLAQRPPRVPDDGGTSTAPSPGIPGRAPSGRGAAGAPVRGQ